MLGVGVGFVLGFGWLVGAGVGVAVGFGVAVGAVVGVGVAVGVVVDPEFEVVVAVLETVMFSIFQWMSLWWLLVTSKMICPMWLKLTPNLLMSTV